MSSCALHLEIGTQKSNKLKVFDPKWINFNYTYIADGNPIDCASSEVQNLVKNNHGEGRDLLTRPNQSFHLLAPDRSGSGTVRVRLSPDKDIHCSDERCEEETHVHFSCYNPSELHGVTFYDLRYQLMFGDIFVNNNFVSNNFVNDHFLVKVILKI